MTARPLPPGYTRRRPAPPLSDAERAVVERFDAAPDLDLDHEARVETVARAMFDHANPFDYWDSVAEYVREHYRNMAAAALAADDAHRAAQAGDVASNVMYGDVDYGACMNPADARALWERIRAALAPAGHEPAAAIGRLPVHQSRCPELYAVTPGRDDCTCPRPRPDEAALADQLRRAVARLEERRDRPGIGSFEKQRLEGKIEGVKLAASYLENGERIFPTAAVSGVQPAAPAEDEGAPIKPPERPFTAPKPANYEPYA
jgi:hypothetical protein